MSTGTLPTISEDEVIASLRNHLENRKVNEDLEEVFGWNAEDIFSKVSHQMREDGLETTSADDLTFVLGVVVGYELGNQNR